MNRQLRHNLWLWVVIVAVGLGGFSCGRSPDHPAKPAATVATSTPPPRDPDKAAVATPKRPLRDPAKAARLVALAVVPPLQPVALPVPVVLTVAAKPAELPLATVGQVVTAAVPLAGVGAGAPAPTVVPLGTVSGGLAALPVPVASVELPTTPAALPLATVTDAAPVAIPLAEVGPSDAAAQIAARTVPLASVSSTQVVPVSVAVAELAPTSNPPVLATASLSAAIVGQTSSLSPVSLTVSVDQASSLLPVSLAPSTEPSANLVPVAVVTADAVRPTIPLVDLADLPHDVRPLNVATVSLSSAIVEPASSVSPVSLAPVEPAFSLWPVSLTPSTERSADLVPMAVVMADAVRPTSPLADLADLPRDVRPLDIALARVANTPAAPVIPLATLNAAEDRTAFLSLATLSTFANPGVVALATIGAENPRVVPVARLVNDLARSVWNGTPGIRALEAVTLREMRVEEILPVDPRIAAHDLAGSEPALAAWLTKWEADIQQGLSRTERGQPPSALNPQPLSRSERGSTLDTLLSHTSLTCTQLYPIGLGVEFVEGMAGAAPFYRAVLAKAETELRGHARNDPADAPVMQVLSQLGGFWSLRDWVSLERVYRLLKEHVTANSPFELCAEFLQGEALYELGRGVDKSVNLKAADIYRGMLQRPEVQQWSKTDQAQVHFLLACALYQGGQFAEAASHFQVVSASSNIKSYIAWARQFHVSALARAGRVQEAKEQYDLWLRESNPSKQAAEHVAHWIQLMEPGSVAGKGKLQ